MKEREKEVEMHIRLDYPGHLIKEPVLFDICKKDAHFKNIISLNFLSAMVTEDEGTMTLKVKAKNEDALFHFFKDLRIEGVEVTHVEV